MYYDLIASLPHLKHFTATDHSPITRLKLIERLKRLCPEHIEQLQRVRPLVAWRPEQMIGRDEVVIRETSAALEDSSLDHSLRAYLALRVDQKMLLAATRSKRAGLALPAAAQAWGRSTRLHLIRRNWALTDFGLSNLYPWFPQAQALLDANDARGLERLLMDRAWQWLTNVAERSMFSLAAVFSYVFRWDIQQAWLICDSAEAKSKFSELIDKVTCEQHN
jgi:hypothetical protein